MSFKQELADTLKQFPIKRAALFGSMARGEETAYSDIDILVEPETSLTIFDILRMESVLEQKFLRKIDIVEFAAIKHSIKDTVLNQMVELI
ncbi:MAG TPA: nucleotidyltransferase domain-containing protein [Chitinophagales bacterium]|nr:nucleotidyltransferase domain-containing protein [Chitinophagales bacterium]